VPLDSRTLKLITGSFDEDNLDDLKDDDKNGDGDEEEKIPQSKSELLQLLAAANTDDESVPVKASPTPIDMRSPSPTLSQQPQE
jgi:hypothetical protein